ncbi:hypothetical protein CFC21_090278 [Triticum aestivum]|uniref:Leucine-rich repeat-containing N-terminal plant-type domain-containing protein n=2 Tax=Triticum aestivum TaxID=4565 RepID=A0A3B6PV85_WHEAT|nr:hypothetical protein CFC21_090278 [Triticum aestivum]
MSIQLSQAHLTTPHNPAGSKTMEGSGPPFRAIRPSKGAILVKYSTAKQTSIFCLAVGFVTAASKLFLHIISEVIALLIYSSHIAGQGGLLTCQPARLARILTLLSLLLISCGVGSIRCSSSTTTIHDNSTDMISLLDFKRAITNDSSQALRSWHVGVPLCGWKGVVCSDPKHLGRVIELNLMNLSLSGTISPSLGNLTFLRRLDLFSNGCTSKIPPLNRLQRLEYLDLGYNSLQGIIPNTLTNCSNLWYLVLSSNLLIGEVPSGIGCLSNLVSLELGGNNLTGEIPPSLKNSSQLEYIWLADNKLTGTIPDELGKLPNLSYLYLEENRLSGRIPKTLYKYNQSCLKILDLSSNMLGKTLSSNFGDTLLNL